MKRLGNLLSVVAVISFVVLGAVGSADAQRRNERQIRDLVRTLNAQIDDFQYGLDYHLRSTSSGAADVEGVHDSIRNLQTKVDDLDESVASRRDNSDDINEIVAAAMDVHMFLKINPQNQRINTNWQNVRTTINNLAANYGVKPDWNPSDYSSTTTRSSNTRVKIQRPGDPMGNPRGTVPPRDPVDDDTGGTVQPRDPVATNGLTGTYAIDTARSENIADIISGSGVAANQRQDLESKLEAPEQIAIDLRGNQVTLASSKASPVSFVADGRDKVEQSNGRTVRLRATLRGEELSITSLGGETDYTVTFLPMDNGRGMKVTRRITTDYLSETIFAESYYNKTDSAAGLGIDRNVAASTDDDSSYSSNDPDDRNRPNTPGPSVVQSRTGDFIVPSGTLVTGLLESSIDTKVTRNNDRFRLTVQSPNQFRGATIEGYVTGVGRSGRVSGRSNVTFNFESITLRNGQRYDFSGLLQSVRDESGNNVKIDTEGTVKGGSQTRETVKRGGIGAGIGAIIGAIAGGGTGAAIGAVIGGSAGAGSVVVQGRDDLQLSKGSMITIRSSSPRDPVRVTDK